MNLDNSALPINKLIDKINDTARNNQTLNLSIEEVKLLSKELGDTVFIPVLTNEQVVQLCKDGKLGQSMFPKKDN